MQKLLDEEADRVAPMSDEEDLLAKKAFSMRPIVRAAIRSLSLGATAVACGTSATTPSDSGGPEGSSSCTPGLQGVQACTDDGPCGCADATTIDGGPDSTGDTGSGRDAPGDQLVSDVTNRTTRDAEAGPADGNFQWAENFGLTGMTFPRAVGLDPSNGDIVVGGDFWGSTDFGGGVLTSLGDGGSANGYSQTDAFVVRLDSAGSYRWAKSYGNGLNVVVEGAVVDTTGRVAIAGDFQGSVSFGCTTHTARGVHDIFLAMLDATGGCVWSKSFSTTSQRSPQNLYSLTRDGANNLLIAGRAVSVDFGGDAGTGFYIAKFDATGAYQWSDVFAATTTREGPSLAVDPSGNPVLAGSFVSTVNFGGGTLTSVSNSDAFVAKFDSAGAYQWAKQYGDVNTAESTGVSTDAAGNIFVTGSFGGTINFGTGNLVGPTTSNNFLAKVDATGKGVWAKMFTNVTQAGIFNAGGVAVAGAQGVALTSGFAGSVDYGGGPMTHIGGQSVAIASFDPAGAYRWAYQVPANTPGNAYLGGLSANSASVVLAGHFMTSSSGTTLVLGGKTLTAVSAADLFLASWTP